MRSPLDLILDNPIIVKHARSRLRLAQIVPGMVVVLSLCLLFTWIGYYTGSIGSGFTLYTLTTITAMILVIGGSHQVASAVGSAKESGILDFHRVSPLPAFTVTLGFFLGAPIREYLLFALLVPFLAISALSSSAGLSGLFNLLAPLVLTAWLTHALSVLVALVAKKSRTASAGVFVLLIIGLWVGSASYAGYRDYRRMQGLQEEPTGLQFFGLTLPVNAFLALYEGTAIVFLLIAGTRKMRAERAMAFSKPEALACMAAVVTLALGAFWTVGGTPWVVPMLLYGFVVAGLVLAATITPDSGEYAKGVRRALRSGHRRPPIWADSASNAWFVYGLAGMVALGTTVAWEAIELALPGMFNSFGPNSAPRGAMGPISYSQTIAVGVFTVAYFGLGKQYFALKYGRKGETYFRLFLFLVWILPLLAGVAAGVASFGSSAVQIAMGISPVAGMILSIKGLFPDSVSADYVRFMALLPSLTFAFVFNFLLTNEQRRIDRTLRETTKPKEKVYPVFA